MTPDGTDQVSRANLSAQRGQFGEVGEDVRIADPKDQSCRGILAELHRRGELLTIREPVDALHDVAALMSIVDDRAAVRFEFLKGYDVPIFGNILSSLDRVALALGVTRNSIQDTLLAAIAEPESDTVLVDNAPVQEITESDEILTNLPIPTFFEKETGAYITAGLIVARDLGSGRGNLSYARIKVLGPKEGMIGIAPNHHLAIMARRAAAQGRSLPIAVVLGAHPAIQLAGCLYLGFGDDEMKCAGALLGEPVKLTRCKTVDLSVPAEAEIVLEGNIQVDAPITEGPVSEYHGMYEDYGSGFRVSFECQTRRRDAALQVVLPGYHMEHVYLGGVAIAAGLRSVLAGVIRNVGQVAVTVSGYGRTNVVVQIDMPRPGQARRAMMAVWGAVSIVKNVTVVDADVDPWDEAAVELAKMSRLRADRDILIVPDMGTDRSEPLEAGGLVPKVGYDATCRPGDRKLGFDKALPPAGAYDRMKALLAEHHPEFDL